MKTLRDQILERIKHLGGEQPEYYKDYSDYDVLDDFENLVRSVVESERQSKSDIMDLNN